MTPKTQEAIRARLQQAAALLVEAALILFSLARWLLLLTVPILLVLQLWFAALDVILVVLLMLKLFGTFGH